MIAHRHAGEESLKLVGTLSVFGTAIEVTGVYFQLLCATAFSHKLAAWQKRT